MREVALTQGKIALIDDEDYERVMGFKWHYSDYNNGKGYAKTNNPSGKPALLRMHRFIMGAVGKEKVDHRNMDTLDNRKSNLRIATQSQNMINAPIRITNTSGYKGVCYDKRWKNWIANIWKEGKQNYLGSFKTKEEAAIAYNKAAIKLHGDFARLNKVDI